MFVDTISKVTIERDDDRTTRHTRCGVPSFDRRGFCLGPVTIKMLANMRYTYATFISTRAEYHDAHVGRKGAACPFHVALPIGFKQGISGGQRRLDQI